MLLPISSHTKWATILGRLLVFLLLPQFPLFLLSPLGFLLLFLFPLVLFSSLVAHIAFSLFEPTLPIWRSPGSTTELAKTNTRPSYAGVVPAQYGKPLSFFESKESSGPRRKRRLPGTRKG